MGMENCSNESISTISETIFHQAQYPDLEFSNESSFKEENESRFSSSRSKNSFQKKKKKNQVFVEKASDEEDLVRAKSLTDEDLDELKGCLDLGFGFSYNEIPELCNTLPALELCYSMSQKLLDEQQKQPDTPSNAAEGLVSETGSQPHGSVASWKISSPGDDPEEVKARLKYWAQAVACTVKLCN